MLVGPFPFGTFRRVLVTGMQPVGRRPYASKRGGLKSIGNAMKEKIRSHQQGDACPGDQHDAQHAAGTLTAGQDFFHEND